jgi:hypothetical protein
MPKPRTRPRFRCRFCGATFSAWLAVPGEPDGALLHHITQSHPGELTPFLDQMHTTDDLTMVGTAWGAAAAATGTRCRCRSNRRAYCSQRSPA